MWKKGGKNVSPVAERNKKFEKFKKTIRMKKKMSKTTNRCVAASLVRIFHRTGWVKIERKYLWHYKWRSEATIVCKADPFGKWKESGNVLRPWWSSILFEIIMKKKKKKRQRVDMKKTRRIKYVFIVLICPMCASLKK